MEMADQIVQSATLGDLAGEGRLVWCYCLARHHEHKLKLGWQYGPVRVSSTHAAKKAPERCASGAFLFGLSWKASDGSEPGSGFGLQASGKRQRTQFLKSQQPLEPVHRADFCNKIGQKQTKKRLPVWARRTHGTAFL
jgi:hypothetical protein